jgi:hypothetical protein
MLFIYIFANTLPQHSYYDCRREERHQGQEIGRGKMTVALTPRPSHDQCGARAAPTPTPSAPLIQHLPRLQGLGSRIWVLTDEASDDDEKEVSSLSPFLSDPSQIWPSPIN